MESIKTKIFSLINLRSNKVCIVSLTKLKKKSLKLFFLKSFSKKIIKK